MKPQIDDIGILKTIRKKNEVGAWASYDLKSIDLKPRQGFSRDYFRIESELTLMTERPGPIMDTSVRLRALE